MEQIRRIINESSALHRDLLEAHDILNVISVISEGLVGVFSAGNKALLCGNGGSAADAQHIAAELSGRFFLDRKPLDAEALHVNTSYLTAVANDYSYDEVFARLVRAKGKPGDALIALSTSGNSKNVANALEMAGQLRMITIGLTGRSGGRMVNLCQHIIRVPSDSTPRIQEAHILIGHIICEIVEEGLFGSTA